MSVWLTGREGINFTVIPALQCVSLPLLYTRWCYRTVDLSLEQVVNEVWQTLYTGQKTKRTLQHCSVTPSQFNLLQVPWLGNVVVHVGDADNWKHEAVHTDQLGRTGGRGGTQPGPYKMDFSRLLVTKLSDSMRLLWEVDIIYWHLAQYNAAQLALVSCPLHMRAGSQWAHMADIKESRVVVTTYVYSSKKYKFNLNTLMM